MSRQRRTKSKVRSPIAKRLRQIRTSLGLSQRKLGILAGMDEFGAGPRVTQYETDRYVPDFTIAKRLAKVLDIPVTYLYAEDEQLAELILLFANSKPAVRKEVLAILRSSQRN